MIWLIIGAIIGFGIITYLYGDVFLLRSLRRKKKPEPEPISDTKQNSFQEYIPYKDRLIRAEDQKTFIGYYKGVSFARKKILDLQDQLANHETGVHELNPTDVIRYRAMVEILTQVLEQRNG